MRTPSGGSAGRAGSWGRPGAPTNGFGGGAGVTGPYGNGDGGGGGNGRGCAAEDWGGPPAAVVAAPFDPRHPRRVLHVSRDGIPSIVKVWGYRGQQRTAGRTGTVV